VALYTPDCGGIDHLHFLGAVCALLAQMEKTKSTAGSRWKRIIMDLDKSVCITRIVDWILVCLFVATAILFIVLLLDLPPRATIFPWFVTSSMVIVAAVYSIGNLTKPERWDTPPQNVSENGVTDHEDTNAATVGASALKGRSREIIHMFLAIYGLAISIALLGHLIAVPLFVFIYILIRREKWWFAIGGAVLIWAFIQLVFIDVMNIQFPNPYMNDWFGI